MPCQLGGPPAKRVSNEMILTISVLKPFFFTLSINAASPFSESAWINPHADISLIKKGLFLLSTRYLPLALTRTGKVWAFAPKHIDNNSRTNKH